MIRVRRAGCAIRNGVPEEMGVDSNLVWRLRGQGEALAFEAADEIEKLRRIALKLGDDLDHLNRIMAGMVEDSVALQKRVTALELTLRELCQADIPNNVSRE